MHEAINMVLFQPQKELQAIVKYCTILFNTMPPIFI